MAGRPNRLAKLFLLIWLLPLVGCSFTRVFSLSQSRPTTDVNPVRTQAAETVVAYITLDAELNPSATVTPTRTRRPPTLTATLTPTLPSATATSAFSPTVTRTRTPPVAPTRTITLYINDQARLFSQSPKDYTVLPAGRDFDIVWVVKNSGRRAWNTDYSYQYSDGVKGSKKETYTLKEDVPIGGEVKLIVDMIAPKEPGQYRTRWVLVNDKGIAFATFFFTFYVSAQ